MNAIAARITGMQHIGLPTNDIEQTIDFYKTLGFEVASTSCIRRSCSAR